LPRGQADEAGVRGQCAIDRGALDRRGAPPAAAAQRGGAHGGDHGLARRRLDGDDGVAGVDRALEGVALVEPPSRR
jgi:hypothetical protein